MMCSLRQYVNFQMESSFWSWKEQEKGKDCLGYQYPEKHFGLPRALQHPLLHIDRKAVHHLVVS